VQRIDRNQVGHFKKNLKKYKLNSKVGGLKQYSALIRLFFHKDTEDMEDDMYCKLIEEINYLMKVGAIKLDRTNG
jgi:hypothetical protein